MSAPLSARHDNVDDMTDWTMEQKKDALSHICYEMGMVLKATRSVDRSRALGDGQDGDYLELQLLHTRCLVEFLIEPEDRRQKDDMRRSEFAPAWDAVPIEAVQRLESRATRHVVNKHLAHLTWARVVDAKQPWHYPEIGVDVLAVFLKWVKHVSAHNEKLGDSLKFQIEMWRNEDRLLPL